MSNFPKLRVFLTSKSQYLDPGEEDGDGNNVVELRLPVTKEFKVGEDVGFPQKILQQLANLKSVNDFFIYIICLFIYSFIHSFIHSYIHLPIHSFFFSFFHSFFSFISFFLSFFLLQLGSGYKANQVSIGIISNYHVYLHDDLSL